MDSPIYISASESGNTAGNETLIFNFNCPDSISLTMLFAACPLYINSAIC